MVIFSENLKSTAIYISRTLTHLRSLAKLDLAAFETVVFLFLRIQRRALKQHLKLLSNKLHFIFSQIQRRAEYRFIKQEKKTSTTPPPHQTTLKQHLKLLSEAEMLENNTIWS